MDLQIKKINDKLDFDVAANNGFCSGTCYEHIDGPGTNPSDGAIYICGTWVTTSNSGTWFWF